MDTIDKQSGWQSLSVKAQETVQICKGVVTLARRKSRVQLEFENFKASAGGIEVIIHSRNLVTANTFRKGKYKISGRNTGYLILCRTL